MADERRQGYTYADLRVGMSFRSPGRTITDADLMSFAGLTGDHSGCTSDVYAQQRFGRRVATGCSGSRTRTGSCGRGPGAARDGDRVSRHRRLEFVAPIFISDDLRQLPAHRASTADRTDAGDRDIRRRARDQDNRVVSGAKTLLVSKVPLTAVEASKRRRLDECVSGYRR